METYIRLARNYRQMDITVVEIGGIALYFSKGHLIALKSGKGDACRIESPSSMTELRHLCATRTQHFPMIPEDVLQLYAMKLLHDETEKALLWDRPNETNG